jgi:hypothetical protein
MKMTTSAGIDDNITNHREQHRIVHTVLAGRSSSKEAASPNSHDPVNTKTHTFPMVSGPPDTFKHWPVDLKMETEIGPIESFNYCDGRAQ